MRRLKKAGSVKKSSKSRESQRSQSASKSASKSRGSKKSSFMRNMKPYLMNNIKSKKPSIKTTNSTLKLASQTSNPTKHANRPRHQRQPKRNPSVSLEFPPTGVIFSNDYCIPYSTPLPSQQTPQHPPRSKKVPITYIEYSVNETIQTPSIKCKKDQTSVSGRKRSILKQKESSLLKH